VRTKARWLFRLHGLLAVSGLAVAVMALTIVVHATTLSAPPVAGLLAACRAWLLPQFNVAQLLVLALGALSLTVLTRATISATRIHRSTRAYMRALVPASLLAEPIAARVITDGSPRAFCAGLLRPRVYISTGAIATLDAAELHAVLAHEGHHAARRDPLRLFAAQVLADALFFLPVMRQLRCRYATLVELAADEAAVGVTGRQQPLASALLVFGRLEGAHVVGVSAERVDHLLGDHSTWELPVSRLLGGVLTLAGLGGLLLALAQVTAIAQISAPMLLMQSCGPLMIGVSGLLFTGALKHFAAPRDAVTAATRRLRWTGRS
jgi:Zn-dependent protease with chaperone function